MINVNLKIVYIPSNQEIEKNLKKRDLNYQIEFRKNLDSNPFSNLEIIKFVGISQQYVLKSVISDLKSEIKNHNIANNEPITAAKLLSSEIDKKFNKYYLIMEKIEFDHLFSLQLNSDITINYYKTIADKLANFHLKYSNISNLKNHDIPIYGISRYFKIIDKLGNRLQILSDAENHEYLLDKELVKEFDNYIGSIKGFLNPFKETIMTLVHGDFDTGNIIVNKIDKDIYAIDYGLSHIDLPIIDIAHLLNATEMNINIRREIFEIYFEKTSKLFPSTMSLQDVRNAGRVMHLLFFLDWYLFAIEKKIVPPNFYFEQIHHRVTYLVELLKHPND